MKYINLIYSRQCISIYSRVSQYYLCNGSRYYKQQSPCLSFSTNTTATEPTVKHRKKSKIPLVNWLYDDFLQGRVKINSFFLYAETTKQVNYLKFFKLFDMEDTFNSWFLVTELHVWMLMTRLRPDGKDGRTASKSLVAALWDDVNARAKVMSPGDVSVSKQQILVLSNEFRASLLIYDEGLLSSDIVLASALWYRLLSKSCEDPRLLELLVVYVRGQIQNLENTPKEEMLERGRISWKPLPDVGKLSQIRN